MHLSLNGMPLRILFQKIMSANVPVEHACHNVCQLPGGFYASKCVSTVDNCPCDVSRSFLFTICFNDAAQSFFGHVVNDIFGS